MRIRSRKIRLDFLHGKSTMEYTELFLCALCGFSNHKTIKSIKITLIMLFGLFWIIQSPDKYINHNLYFN